MQRTNFRDTVAQYNQPDSTSPVGSASAQLSQSVPNQELNAVKHRMDSRLEFMERELSRAKNRIRELETKIDLILQRVNARP